MSRFFGALSESDSSSDDDSGYDHVETTQTATRFEFESSSDEEEKRVVRSFKDKRFSAMHDIIKRLRNNIKTKDWGSMVVGFDDLNAALKKAKKIVEAEGIPRFYLRIMTQLADLHRETKEKKQKPKNKLQSKAFNKLGQKLRRNREDHVEAFEKFEENPDDDDDAADDVADSGDEDSDSDDDTGDDDDGDASDHDSVDWDESDSDSSDSDFEVGAAITRDFWVKKEKTDELDDKAKKDKKERERQARTEKEAAKKREKEQKEKEKAERQKGAKQEVKYTPELILRKLKELLSKFGRRTTDKEAMIRDLRVLLASASDPATKLKVSVTLVSALFDRNLNKADYMPIDQWLDCYQQLKDMIAFLGEHPNVRLSEDENVEESFEEEVEADAKDKAPAPTPLGMTAEQREAKRQEQEDLANAGVSDAERKQYVSGNLFSFVDRLRSEYVNSMRSINSHSQDYIVRLRDEEKLVDLFQAARTYYQSIQKTNFEARIALTLLEYQSYRYDPDGDALKPPSTAAATEEKKGSSPPDASSASSSSSSVDPLARAYEHSVLGVDQSPVSKLACFLYRHGDNRARTQALLLHVYFLAHHNRYAEARDLFLMSHIQDSISQADIQTQILFNRAMAQMGLCAFRCGDVRQAMYCLIEFFNSNRIKELLAQGTSHQRWQDRDAQKEKLEKMRLLPFHMHINLDVVEAVHFLSAMFVEIPGMAAPDGFRRRYANKHFRRLFEHHKRQAFNGPAENTKELIMAASRALLVGDWREAKKEVLRLKMWEMVPNKAVVEALIVDKIKDLALETYLLKYSAQYKSISLSSLVDMFEPPNGKQTVVKVVSTMIMRGKLQGALDEPNDAIAIFASEPTRLQKAALRFADKVNVFLDQNQRLLDQRGGGGGYRGGDDRYNNRGGFRGNRKSNNRYNNNRTQDAPSGGGNLFRSFRRS